MSVKADLRVILGLDKAGFDRSLASATSSVNRFSRQTATAKKSIGTLLGGAGLGSLAKFGGYAAALSAVGKAMGDVVANGRALETSMSHLQSLTGLSTDVMGRVKQMATDTAMAMGISSDQIIDSYGVIGSKMPELLKSPEALDAIARSAATLAKAGVMPLEASIESLTGIMNQMGASAEEADTYINVLAAGSKNGAGNIEYLATAFTKCGSAIRNAGLSVQQGTALIEALAKRMPDAAEAGTALRNVLLVMGTTAGDDLNPKIVGLDKAMENLHARIGDHANKANDRIRQTADDRYEYYRNDRDTKGNLRYNDAQARQQAINELRAKAKEEQKAAQKWADGLKDFHKHGVTSGPAVKKYTEQLEKHNNNIRAYNEQIRRLARGETAAPAPAVPTPTAGGGKKTGKAGGSRGTKNGPTYVAGSLKDYEAQLSKLNAVLQGNVDVTQLSEEQLEEYGKQFADLYQKIKAAKDVLKQFEVSTTQLGKVVDSAKTPKFKDLFGTKPALPGKLSGVNVPKSANQKLIEGQISLNNELERTSELYENIGSAMGDMGQLTMATFANISNVMSVFKSEVGDTKAKIGAMGAALSSAGQAVGAIGAAMEDKGMQIGGLIAQTIGNLALSFAMAMKGAGQLGPIGWAAFGIAGLAQLIAMVAQIKSLTSGYASGGIIQGNSYHGDQMYVRANAGEMILTQGQQSRLFRMLDGGIYNGGAGQVEFVINGSQLKGVLNNFNRKTSKLA